MRVELTLETVTPLFLAGANQQYPELRAPSVRGQLRFWLRTALGGIIGDTDLDRLRRLEAEVFGATDQASAVVVRLSPISISSREESLLPHKGGSTAKAIQAGSTFDLILTVRPRVRNQILEIATWSALLWLTLGGCGRRSRRGGGSVRLIKVGPMPSAVSSNLKECLITMAVPAVNGQALAERVGAVLQSARRAFGAFSPFTPPPPMPSMPTFSLLLPDTRVVVWTPPDTKLNDPNSVLKSIMNKMSHLQSSLKGTFPKAFGGIAPRRASPLIVTAHRLEKEWALVLTYLKAEIHKSEAGNPGEVTKFLNSLDPKSEAHPCPVLGGIGHE